MGAPDTGEEVGRLSELLREQRHADGTFVVAITGAVASGKSTVSVALKNAIEAWSGTPSVALVSTDGFLLPNRILDDRGLGARKGFPETYDAVALRDSLEAVRRGSVIFPGYSHVTYDLDAALDREVDRPDVLVVEGLGLGSTRPPARLDTLLYLDAEEADLEAWYVARFVDFWRSGAEDSASFYFRFRGLTLEGVTELARAVWAGVNLPNLREHILPVRDLADIVVRKGPDHRFTQVLDGRRKIDRMSAP
jgi:type I pantothenate kinase